MKIVKKLLGLDKVEASLQKAQQDLLETSERLAEAEKAAEEARKQEELSKMAPKERATAQGEPWVAVLDTKVNKDNIRNGFFELDWNEEFIVQLKRAGYGTDGDPDEEIVDRWFKELCRNILTEEGLDSDRNFGYVNSDVINRSRTQ